MPKVKTDLKIIFRSVKDLLRECSKYCLIRKILPNTPIAYTNEKKKKEKQNLNTLYVEFT